MRSHAAAGANHPQILDRRAGFTSVIVEAGPCNASVAGTAECGAGVGRVSVVSESAVDGSILELADAEAATASMITVAKTESGDDCISVVNGGAIGGPTVEVVNAGAGNASALVLAGFEARKGLVSTVGAEAVDESRPVALEAGAGNGCIPDIVGVDADGLADDFLFRCPPGGDGVCSSAKRFWEDIAFDRKRTYGQKSGCSRYVW